MTRRYPKVAAAVLAGVMALAACSADVDEPAEADDDEVYLPTEGFTVWSISGGSDVVVDSTFRAWNQDHPDDQIEVAAVTNDDYKDYIAAGIEAGEVPTLIVGWAGADLEAMVSEGVVMDLTGRVNDLDRRVLQSVADVGRIDNRTYAVPFNQTQPVVLYSNKEVLDQHGLEAPETFDDLLAAVETLDAAGTLPIALAGGSRWPELMWIQYLTDRIGGPEVFRSVVAGEPDAWSDPAILEALRSIRALVDAGAFGDDIETIVADGGMDTSLVGSGHAAFVLHGAWVYPDFVTNAPALVASDGLGFSTFPSVEGGAGDPSNIVGNPANYWSVSALAAPEDQERAIDFLNEQAFSDYAVERFLTVRTVPPVREVGDALTASEDADYLEFVYSMVADAGHFQLSWDQELPPDQAGALLDNLHEVFLGNLSPQGFVTAMNATL